MRLQAFWTVWSHEPELDLVHRVVEWVHAGIMAFQAVMDSSEHGHLFGDVPPMVLVGVVLAVLVPKTLRPMKAAA